MPERAHVEKRRKMFPCIVFKKSKTVQLFRSPTPVCQRGKKIYDCSVFDIWSLGITITIAGSYVSWNEGLACGFGGFSLAIACIGSAYLFLVCSISEMISALPFAGGAYGLVRCTLGFYPGFLVGCCEAFEFILCVSQATTISASLICSSFGITSGCANPLLCLMFYVISAGVQIQGTFFLFKFANILAVASFTIILLYLGISFQSVRFTENVVSRAPFFVGNFPQFFASLPTAAWFFWGIEALVFACDMTGKSNPRVIIPRGCVVLIVTLLATSVLIFFVSCSLPPGIDFLKFEFLPLHIGFTYLGVSFRNATLFTIPASLAAAYGYMFAYGKLIYFLASSGLLPRMLCWKWKSRDTPVAAIVVGSILSYAVCLVILFFPSLGVDLDNVCLVPAFIGYCLQCVGYLYLKTKFQKIKRLFHSPFGISGAVFSFVVFSCALVSAAGFQRDRYIALLSNICVCVVLSIYYFTIVKFSQTFSAEEQRIFGNADIISKNITVAALQLKARKSKRKLSKRLMNAQHMRRSRYYLSGGRPPGKLSPSSSPKSLSLEGPNVFVEKTAHARVPLVGKVAVSIGE